MVVVSLRCSCFCKPHRVALLLRRESRAGKFALGVRDSDAKIWDARRRGPEGARECAAVEASLADERTVGALHLLVERRLESLSGGNTSSAEVEGGALLARSARSPAPTAPPCMSPVVRERGRVRVRVLGPFSGPSASAAAGFIGVGRRSTISSTPAVGLTTTTAVSVSIIVVAVVASLVTESLARWEEREGRSDAQAQQHERG